MNYLIRCNLKNSKYIIYGYKGKQVRDNIHSEDVKNFVKFFFEKPRVAEVYNIGGGRQNSISILEAIALVEKITGKKMNYTYNKNQRIGDHKCYISNLKKIKNHYPRWNITYNLRKIFEDIIYNIR